MKKKSGPNIIEFTTDKQLLNLSLSPAQTVLLKSVYGLPITKDERALFTQCTGRAVYRTHHQYSEVTVVAGARSGKDSRIAGPIVCFEAFFGGHAERLHKGEKAVIALVATDRDQTQVAFQYIKSYIMDSPYLRAEVAAEPLSNEIQLKSGIRILTFPSSLKSLRAYSIPVAVLDELAFYRFEGGSNSDVEIQASVRRGMIGFTNTRLVKVSTPFLREGVLHRDFEQAYGKDDPDLLVWQASTALMNPSIGKDRLDRERRMDGKRFAREFEAQFVEDTTAFIPQPLIERAVITGREALPALAGRYYIGAVDASGGGSCSFTISVVTLEPDQAGTHRIVECQSKGWEKSRTEALDLEATVSEAASIFTAYGCYSVMSDRYSSGWNRQAFARHGIALIDAPDKSTVYSELEPLFTAGRVELLDTPVKNRQLALLERKMRPGGKPLIGPPRGAHDDYANSFALACVAAAQNADLPPVTYTIPLEERLQLEQAFGSLGDDGGGLTHVHYLDDIR